MKNDKEDFENLMFEMREAGINMIEIDAMLLSQEIGEMTGSVLLTNTKKEDKKLFLQAAKKTSLNIYIEDEAFDCYGNILLDCCAVYTRDLYKDHSPLWEEIKKLESL